MSRCFMPEALAGLAPLRVLDADDRRRLNQIRACSYLHLFDVLETSRGAGGRARWGGDGETREGVTPRRPLDSLDPHQRL
jgi:hypothetical protein